jgi:hypothetical protein
VMVSGEGEKGKAGTAKLVAMNYVHPPSIWPAGMYVEPTSLPA